MKKIIHNCSLLWNNIFSSSINVISLRNPMLLGIVVGCTRSIAIGKTQILTIINFIAFDPTFGKFYLIRTSFTLGELVFLVKVFTLFGLEWIFLVFSLWTQYVWVAGPCEIAFFGWKLLRGCEIALHGWNVLLMDEPE